MRADTVILMVSTAQNTDGFVISMADMPKGGQRKFDLTFSNDMLLQAKDTLQVRDIRKVRIKGTLVPDGRKNWLLQADVGASVTQACVLSLAPVKTRIDTSLRHLFLADWQEPEGDSVVEMTGDADSEPLGAEINLEQIALEAVAMVLPTYPHAEGATLETQVFTEPGATPLTDEMAKPFAGLAALKDKMGGKG